MCASSQCGSRPGRAARSDARESAACPMTPVAFHQESHEANDGRQKWIKAADLRQAKKRE